MSLLLDCFLFMDKDLAVEQISTGTEKNSARKCFLAIVESKEPRP